MASQWRVDAGNDVPKVVAYDRGYKRTLDDLFERTGVVIGKGGFGLVTTVVERSTKLRYACKSINKRLNVPNISLEKVEQHLANIDREVKVLKLLRGTLSVVNLKGVYEDDESVHIVMEYCKGGELYANLSKHGALTEAKVSMYMRSVLQTLAQCHSHRILHRDIKPGNFLLLSEDENSPLKAVDFGLAVMWEKDELLPRTDLGLDGTPWFMAPEVISDSETYPASDVWSAGVMCYQLLSGKLPFDDRQNRREPALSIVWRSILTDEVSFKRKEWDTVSNEAKAFVIRILNKDPKQRPTAREALKDPWLLSTFHAGREGLGPLDSTVVQRLQRFAQANLLQRTILELVASELVKVMPAGWLLDETVRAPGGTSRAQPSGSSERSGRSERSESNLSSERYEQTAARNMSPMSIGLQRKDSKDELVFPMSPEQVGGGAASAGPMSIPGIQRLGLDPHSPYLKSQGAQSQDIRQASSRSSLQSPIKQRTAAWRITSPSIKGPKGQRLDWKAMRQASELVLQGSGHRQSNYLHACSGLDPEERMEQRKAARLSLDTSVHGRNLYRDNTILQHDQPSTSLSRSQFIPDNEGLSWRRKDQSGSRRSGEFPFPADDMSPTLTPPSSSSATSYKGNTREADLEKGVRGQSLALEALQSSGSNFGNTAVNNAINSVSNPITLAPLMNKVGFRRGKVMTKNSLLHGLSTLGYSVEEDELSGLMDRVGLADDSGGIKEAEFLASQLDWKDLQRNNKELWIECAKNAFRELDASKTGHISIEKLLQNLRSKIPDEEVDFAVEDALVDANLKDAAQVDFEGFMKLVTMGSYASLDGLDNYPDRLSLRPRSSRDFIREKTDTDALMEE
jgi:serine/threonine protein kinase/Ca2+-binding EF-hand superfamily protein